MSQQCEAHERPKASPVFDRDSLSDSNLVCVAGMTAGKRGAGRAHRRSKKPPLRQAPRLGIMGRRSLFVSIPKKLFD